ncbi:hypothetical protein [Amycolatopsis sp. cmx-4-83]|uniref:hypothetical protein n=1 Tax=Amycolatopsis sp. cmx-4-83 TaxID=2790940 RepID=UPI00397A654F
MILQHEPCNIATRVEIPTESSNWAIAIDQHVLDYEDMTELRQYVEHVTETIDRETSYLDFSGPIYAGSNFIGVAAQESTTAEVDTKPDSSNNYVSSRFTESLKAKSEASSFDLDKLLRLTSELNQNFAQRNPYACHALLRTILDHIPRFSVSGISMRWPRTTAGRGATRSTSSSSPSSGDRRTMCCTGRSAAHPASSRWKTFRRGLA